MVQVQINHSQRKVEVEPGQSEGVSTLDQRGAWYAALKSYAHLATDPVGIAMLDKAAPLADTKVIASLTCTALCQMLARSRFYREEGVCGTSTMGMKCVWAASCLGMIRTPERLREGCLNRAFTADAAAAEELQRGIFAIGDTEKRYAGVVTAPLDLMPQEVDAIVIYLTPGQALRLIIGLLYKEGKAMNCSITGQASVCASVARVLEGERAVLDIPCVGDRTYGLVKDEEMVMVLHPDIMEQLLEGLAGTEGMASHPFKPFLRWNALFPPEFEPVGRELE
jgi:uncharacterized protein (DUF169 family)